MKYEVGHCDEVECYVEGKREDGAEMIVRFSGPNAYFRAVEYAKWKNAQRRKRTTVEYR